MCNVRRQFASFGKRARVAVDAGEIGRAADGFKADVFGTGIGEVEEFFSRLLRSERATGFDLGEVSGKAGALQEVSGLHVVEGGAFAGRVRLEEGMESNHGKHSRTR